MTFIKYIKPSKEVYFQFYSSPTKVEVQSKEDALKYLEKFYEEQKERLESFKRDLDLFKYN
jgi:hypothetical protein|tara:strand:+ start:32291 stop:32473 length:183 start_codon:yes stop_codon:yes gene_type:complete